MTITAQALLPEVLAAHGGLERWRRFERVRASVVSGGFLWGMKGYDLGDTPRTITSTFRRQWTHLAPFGAPDWHMIFEPPRVTIATATDEVVAEQTEVRATFADHAWETPWAPPQLAYFNGYAMWTYYNLPFVLTEPGYTTTEVPQLEHEGRLLRGLHIRFPSHVHTHSAEQTLWFDDDGLLARHDYTVDVAGGNPAAHLVSDYVEVQGLRFPTRRRVYVRRPDGTLERDRAVVTIDLSEFALS